MTVSRSRACLATLSVAAMGVFPAKAFAVEGGAGFYLLGSKGPAAAITPPPGLYLSNDVYIYTGDLGGGTELPTGGRIAVGVDATAVIELPTFLWVLPEEVMGGHLGLSATLPIGWKDVSADVTLAGPLGGTAAGSLSDSTFTVGDPVLGASVGWNSGNFYWQVGTLVNVPIGDYEEGELSNIAFHHWGADVNAAVTWLDPAIGLDLSAAVGVTFNAENPTTDYKSGNEFHFEWAAVKHFNEQFDAGLVGYYYNQLTDDSGAGARFDFQGETVALGLTFGWSFKVGERPISTRLKYFHEFSSENRPKGDVVFVNVTMPLGQMASVPTK